MMKYKAINQLVLLCLGIVFLAGCTSTKITTFAIDQPLPLACGIPFCLSPEFRKSAFVNSVKNDLIKLKEGEVCQFIIQPGSKYNETGNATGILISSNERYSIKVHENQYWYDKDRKVPAPEGDTGGGITKHLSILKHHGDDKWFALYASVNHSDKLIKNLSNKEDPRPEKFDGELTFYVNDASSFYENNQGRVVVLIKHCKQEYKCDE